MSLANLRVPCICLLTAIVAILATGCGGEPEGAVEVSWRVRAHEGSFATDGGAPLPTVIQLYNGTDRTIRGARLRFDPAEAAAQHAGLHIGTVTNVSSSFEGSFQVWELGDLPPNSRLDFNLALWLESAFQTTGHRELDLQVELASADLEGAVTSNRLTVSSP